MMKNAMCGRFTLRASPADLAQAFELFREEPLVPRYNIAPTQEVAVIRGPKPVSAEATDSPAETGSGRRLTMMRWGLIPSWAKDASGAAKLINARADTLAEKASFRTAFQRRRCLIPADGFYEWKALDRKSRQPFLIAMKSGRPFAFAGIWEAWRPKEGELVHSCSIITTEANPLLRDLHDRMPVILDPAEYGPWLDPECPAEALQQLLNPFPPDAMEFHPVSTFVNNARHEGAECLDPPEPNVLPGTQAPATRSAKKAPAKKAPAKKSSPGAKQSLLFDDE